MTSNSDFGRETTGSDVARNFKANVTSRNILITGCSPGGIGTATAKALAEAGAGLLILAGRSQSKLDAVVSELKHCSSDTDIRTLILDLSSQASVRKAAAEVNAYEESIDILINNAAIFVPPERTLTEDGLEVQFGTNHIGHFLFTNLILEKLKSTTTKSDNQTRIVNVSSLAYLSSPVRFSDYNWDGVSVPEDEAPDWSTLNLLFPDQTKTSGYNGVAAYAQSKTANILFTVALNKRLSGKNGIQSFAIHPGVVRSAGAAQTIADLDEKTKALPMFFLKDLDQGCSTTLVAALDPKLDVGEFQGFLSDCQFMDVKPFASDSAIAEKLWELSEKLVGEHFTF